MLIIQANNIHESGAKCLLLNILKSICEPESNLQATVFLDSRFDRSLLEGLVDGKPVTINYVEASVVSRLWSEWAISRLAAKNSGSTLLCLGSIPPLFPCNAEVVLYYQTVLYFKVFRKYIGGFRSLIKLSVEGFWIRARIAGADRIFVQSSLVKDLLCKEFLLDECLIKVMPFADLESLKAVSSPIDSSARKGFFYPALGTAHKNHILLIDAWVILAKQGIFPVLLLTLDRRFERILTHLEQARETFGICATNLGLLSHQQVLDQLLVAEAMIFPSLCESFGLPLLEARENGLPVIACERDYVREILDPVETFDPESALSLARAVKRFLGIKEQPLTVVPPETLLNSVVGKESAAI
jgi:glycosyltransferase involved in cell wall biosynthesis